MQIDDSFPISFSRWSFSLDTNSLFFSLRYQLLFLQLFVSLSQVSALCFQLSTSITTLSLKKKKWLSPSLMIPLKIVTSISLKTLLTSCSFFLPSLVFFSQEILILLPTFFFSSHNSPMVFHTPPPSFSLFLIKS